MPQDGDLSRAFSNAQTPPSKFRRPVDATPLRVNTSVPATGDSRHKENKKHAAGAAGIQDHQQETTAPRRDSSHKPIDYPGVKVRYVNLAQRSAFRWPVLPTEDEIVARGTSTSPSLNHLRILRRIQSHQVIRQIHFSPGLGVNADVKLPDGRSRFPTIEPPPLPSPAPRFGRHRLPNRADVGFPNPTAAEVELKQQEIRHETMWEEYSPRLIAHFPRHELDGLKTKHNPASMLAPPLGASYSPSQGWRPRAIHDRPPERLYCLASCLTSFERASLTLYSLPPLYRDKHALNAASAAAYHCRNRNVKPAYGKMSEEFWIRQGPSCGVFSFDPAELYMESIKKTSSVHHSVYLVLRVYNGEREPQYFGVTKFFRDNDQMNWPAAQVKDISLYPYQCSDPSDSFVERLWAIVHQHAFSADDISVNSKRSTLSTASRSRTPPPTTTRKRNQNQHGRARIVLSSLGTDFLQCLLDDCAALRIPTPRLLVDVTGREGVLLEQVGHRLPKRSDLQRIAVTGDVGQFSEVCYLPPQPEKNHNVDCIMPGSRGILNLLFLYPRRFKCLKSTAHFPPDTSFVIQVKCLQAESAIESFQLPGETGLVMSYSTKPLRTNETINSFALDEEVKLRLPDVLDGSYRLVFSLFSGGSLLAESSIPVSTSRNGQGSRIVIPNGKHRLEFQGFQFQVDTRLISSYHIADQALADALCEGVNGSAGEALKSTSMALSQSSESSVVGHFQSLLHMILTSLAVSSPHEVTNAFEKLFEVLAHASSYFSTSNPIHGVEAFALFLKCHVDVLDERVLHSRSNFDSVPTEIEEGDEVDWAFNFQVPAVAADHDEESVLSLSESARRQHRIRNPPRSETSSQGAPFSRAPYTASKLDRMKAAAELHDDDHQFATFFEDDETIATAPSFYSEKKHAGSKKLSIDKVASQDDVLADVDGMVNDEILEPHAAVTFDERMRSIAGAEFAKKVRTAASAVLAPCVGPTFPNFLKQTSPANVPYSNIANGADNFFESVSTTWFGNSKLIPKHRKNACLCPPGSGSSGDAASSKPLNEKLWDESLLIQAAVKQSLVPLAAETNGASRPLYEAIAVYFLGRWKPHETEKCLRDRALSSFLNDTEILLAVALKSFVLMYHDAALEKPQTAVTLDQKHFNLMADFAESLAQAVTIHQAESCLRFEAVLDFVVGLSGTMGSDQSRDFLLRFINSLRHEAPDPLLQIRYLESRFRCARRFLSLPTFFSRSDTHKSYEIHSPQQPLGVSWLHQSHQKNKTGRDHGDDTMDDRWSQGWLPIMAMRDALEICVSASRLLLSESFCETTNRNSQGDDVRRKRLGQGELSMLHTLALGGISSVHDVLFRQHELDARYQSDSIKARLAAMFFPPMLEYSLTSVLVLAELPVGNAVRRLWMGCFLHVLDAPETMIRHFLLRLSQEVRGIDLNALLMPHAISFKEKTHRLVNLLVLAGKTFETEFLQTNSVGETTESAWVRQECFNIICAALNAVVEVAVQAGATPWTDVAIGRDVLCCYRLILAMEQSPVTYLRAFGGAMIVLEAKVDFFLLCIEADVESWIRVLLVAMNCISLSVRSIAVDFIVTLLSGLFKVNGNIDSVLVMIATLLPSVVAQEILGCTFAGLAVSSDEYSRVIWPIRRSVADIEDATPEDDPRIDPDLTALLKHFCRTCQAITDGVLIEFQLSSARPKLLLGDAAVTAFMADEESLYEAACFFLAELAPLQRIRWLLSLAQLQKSKNHWIEAAEGLMLVARTVCDSLPHLKHFWRASRISPQNRSAGLGPDADQFLEPSSFLGVRFTQNNSSKLARPSVSAMCQILTNAVDEAVRFYLHEGDMERIAYGRIEQLHKRLVAVIESHDKRRIGGHNRAMAVVQRRKMAEEETSLRRASTMLSIQMNTLAEKHRDLPKEESPSELPVSPRGHRSEYVLMHLHGQKPAHLYEGTTIPVFIEWGKPCIFRIPGGSEAGDDPVRKFVSTFIEEMQAIVGRSNLVVRTKNEGDVHADASTYFDVFRVDIVDSDPFTISYSSFVSKRFVYKLDDAVIETKVALEFPCALSRQNSLMTTQITLARS